MNFTATIIGQILTFAILVWFVKAFLWQPMLGMLEERQKKVTDGLAAAERGHHEKELAEQHAIKTIGEAKTEAAEIIGRAEKRSYEIVDEAKQTAKDEGERILVAARSEIDKEVYKARQQLRQQVGNLAMVGAQQILGREINADAHAEMLEKLAQQIGS